LWFLRAVEQPDGRWRCRLGSQELGDQPDENAAVRHLARAATALGGRDMFDFHLYRGDGSVYLRRGTDPLPGEFA
jgi:hypothetical protein